jgi:hypothetical protein
LNRPIHSALTLKTQVLVYQELISTLAMQIPSDSFELNPLEGLINEDTYKTLIDHNLLSEKGVRDFQIRRQFRSMRGENVPAYEAIEQLREEYPYLQFDTIRKIVYKLNCARR